MANFRCFKKDSNNATFPWGLTLTVGPSTRQERVCAALSNLACGDEAVKAAVCRLGGVPLLVDVCRAKVSPARQYSVLISSLLFAPGTMMTEIVNEIVIGGGGVGDLWTLVGWISRLQMEQQSKLRVHYVT